MLAGWYLQQMVDTVGQSCQEGFTVDEVQEMPGSGFLRTRLRITRSFRVSVCLSVMILINAAKGWCHHR